jgi:hypothetical protein
MSILDIHTYRAAEGGLSVNSYLIETEDAVVVIDTNLLNSDILALRARICAHQRSMVVGPLDSSVTLRLATETLLLPD